MLIKSKYSKHILLSGLILGVSLSLVEFAAWLAGKFFDGLISNAMVFLTVISLFIAVRKYRNDELGGLISFANAFKIAYLTCIAGGIVWSIYRYIQFSVSPELIEFYIANGKEVLKSYYSDSAYAEQSIEIMRQIITPLFMVFATLFFNILIGGAILSLFLGSILRREIKLQQ